MSSQSFLIKLYNRQFIPSFQKKLTIRWLITKLVSVFIEL
jgi:hypothetical protein